MIGRVRNLLLGRAPHVRRWHPRWADFERPRSALEQILDDPEKRLLIVSSRPTPITNWLADLSDHVWRIPMSRLSRMSLDRWDGFPESFDLRALTGFVQDVKERVRRIKIPVYSHALYDVLPDETVVIEGSDLGRLMRDLEGIYHVPPDLMGVDGPRKRLEIAPWILEERRLPCFRESCP